MSQNSRMAPKFFASSRGIFLQTSTSKLTCRRLSHITSRTHPSVIWRFIVRRLLFPRKFISAHKNFDAHTKTKLLTQIFPFDLFRCCYRLETSLVGQFLANSIFMFAEGRGRKTICEQNKSFLPSFLLPAFLRKMQTRTSNVKVLSRFTFYPCMSSIFICSRRVAEERMKQGEFNRKSWIMFLLCCFMPLHCVSQGSLRERERERRGLTVLFMRGLWGG